MRQGDHFWGYAVVQIGIRNVVGEMVSNNENEVYILGSFKMFVVDCVKCMGEKQEELLYLFTLNKTKVNYGISSWDGWEREM